MGSGHLTHAFYGDMSRASQTPSTPSNASPRFSAISPASQSKQMTSNYVPTDRPPPSRDVSDETLDQAYATFILYCNPNFPTTIDTSELTRLFRTPPKSDGKSFSTWALFELIRKFDSGDIKTWTQLALDLGVERPDTDKGQSTQKVQQYSVRLKVRLSFFSFYRSQCHPPPLQLPLRCLYVALKCISHLTKYGLVMFPTVSGRCLCATYVTIKTLATRQCVLGTYQLQILHERIAASKYPNTGTEQVT